jgi:transposase
MGRPRAGLTTQIHALVDACGLPILLKLTEGQAHDGRSAEDMLGSVGSRNILPMDSAYDSNALRETLAARRARPHVKPMPQRLNQRSFSKRRCRQRNLVERFFNKLKHFRAVATRYDKRDDNCLACVKLASIRIWMRFNESVA